MEILQYNKSKTKNKMILRIPNLTFYFIFLLWSKFVIFDIV